MKKYLVISCGNKNDMYKKHYTLACNYQEGYSDEELRADFDKLQG